MLHINALFKLIIFLVLLIAASFTAYYLQPLKQVRGFSSGYVIDTTWPQLPAGLLLGNPAGIAIDTSQDIVVFHRAYKSWPLLLPMPRNIIKDKTILILDNKTGRIKDSWGQNLFVMPHGLAVDGSNNIWVTDIGLHQVFKFTHSGQLQMTLGQPFIAGKDSLHFDKPTGIAVAADGSFYVSDGYGNSRIIKFSPAGKYLFEWGTKGSKNGHFNIPHAINLDRKGNIYVADRENSRIQIFDSAGMYINQIAGFNIGNVCSVAMNKTNGWLYVTDDVTFLKVKHRGSDVIVFDTLGRMQARFGRSSDKTVRWLHDIAVDSDGNIYAGDILNNKILKYSRAR